MIKTLKTSDFLGQNLKFRQGGRLYLGQKLYQMDGTDGSGRLMLLPSHIYRAVQKRGLDRGSVQYVYVDGVMDLAKKLNWNY